MALKLILTLFYRYQLFDQHFEPSFAYNTIFPLQKKLFLGVNASFPNDIEGVLAIRYPTYKIPLPYKWKCYISGRNLFLTIIMITGVVFVARMLIYLKHSKSDSETVL